MNAPRNAFQLVLGRTSRRTFAALSEMYAWALRQPPGVAEVDCGSLPFFPGNLAAALQVIRERLAENDRELVLNHLRPPVRKLLTDCGFFGTVDRARRSTVVPLTLFEPGEGQRFAIYTQRNLTGKGLPKMSSALQHEVFRGIDEIFTNFEIHARSRAGWACGQLFPSAHRLEFTFVDLGVGIPHVVTSAGHALAPGKCIDWAMTAPNTTRAGDVPGGLGLKVLRELIARNRGSLHVASYSGFWDETGGETTMSHLASPFPGTAVTIVVNTNDTNSYRLVDELKPSDVF